MPFKTIVCPVDGTELTKSALQQATYVAGISGAKLVLLYVVEKWYRSAGVATQSAEWTKIHEQWIEEGKKVVQDAGLSVKDKGLKEITTIVRDGDAAHEIVATAVGENADLIVMATHRYSPVGKLFLGSITDKVSKHSPCPVMWVFAN